jgi:hypothetical protein
MTAEYPQGDEPLISMPALSLPALRQAVATVAPSRLPEFFQEIQDAFTQTGDEEPGAAQAAQERCARRAPGRHAGSARTPPEVPATAARAQRIRSTAVSGCSP